METVSATQSDEYSISINQYEADSQEVTHEKISLFTASESSHVTNKIIGKSNNEETLDYIKPDSNNRPLLNEEKFSSSLVSNNEQSVTFSPTDVSEELNNNLVKSQVNIEKFNNTQQISDSYENTENIYNQDELKLEEHIMENASTLNQQQNESGHHIVSSQEEFKRAPPHHEDIPSFSEWTQKQLAEAEKKKTDQNETTDKFPRLRGKFRIKNYASPDCGAKIVAANPESLSSSSVLSSLKDEYMLNYCTNRIWFIIELCEAIQAKQLDLANFELFSSSPKHFSVFVSHRFPTREWSSVGKFTAQDSRDVQTFNLHPHFFGKYVKVEMHSHYGKEQFCPVSWVGVYGTSEFEVLAKEDERNSLSEDDDGDPYDEELMFHHKKDSPKNLFSSATDAVLSIVKKATAPFMKSDNNQTESNNRVKTESSDDSLCITPRFVVICNNCTINKNQMVLNVTLHGVQTLKNLTKKKDNCEDNGPTKSHFQDSFLPVKSQIPDESMEKASVEIQFTTSLTDETIKSKENCGMKIEPTKTLNEEEMSILISANLKSEKDPEAPRVLDKSKDLLKTEYINPSLATDTLSEISASVVEYEKKEEKDKTYSGENNTEVQKDAEAENNNNSNSNNNNNNNNSNTTNQDSSFDSIISDLNAIEKVESSTSAPFTASNLPSESIFLRLANRIKNLEVNMSLSSTYLEELSKRYRTQLELISKTLNLTIQKVEERAKLEEEKERKREKEIMLIRMQLANLTRDVSTFLREQESWKPQASSVSQHIFFILIEILLLWFFFSYWKKPGSRVLQETEGKKLHKSYERRSSLEGVKGHDGPKKKVRRPSDEALDIALSRTYKIDKKRKRKKKDSKCSLNNFNPKRKTSEGDASQMFKERCSLQGEEKHVKNLNNATENKAEIIQNVFPIESNNVFNKLSTASNVPVISGGSGSGGGGSTGKSFQGITSPPYIKTAASSRDFRLRLGSNNNNNNNNNKESSH
ncbi:conserved hypothetical protein [Pediculus humanus corporis]|uniref:SUN domain-containing protein n=1 Tax=Pediculus humanus subsp. corporis TaxID=121224 RepID=E0VJM7_PEDHC|nr:uncharacterized protein Phum_PHUM248060 [Pediculus humanus corporis]EEB13583.1 conserved hypothetical protein [Pediculus humanus corporis]